MRNQPFIKILGVMAVSIACWHLHALLAAAQSPAAKAGAGPAKGAAIRRVVTGKDASGKAVALIDGPAPNVIFSNERGTTSTLLWVADSTPASVTGTADAANAGRKIGTPPPANGSIFRIVEFPPEKSVKTSDEVRMKAMRDAGLAPEGPTRDHPRHPGMHRTRTIDYVMVISGEIDMLLDDSEVHLKAGDVVVQRATNHSWVNRGDKPCRVAFVLVDAKD